jgi:hypothetical protein
MTTINIWKTHKKLEKNTNGNNIHYGTRDISHILSAILAKKQPKIAYRTTVEFDTCSH